MFYQKLKMSPADSEYTTIISTLSPCWCKVIVKGMAGFVKSDQSDPFTSASNNGDHCRERLMHKSGDILSQVSQLLLQ